jgi:hypothetical protein
MIDIGFTDKESGSGQGEPTQEGGSPFNVMNWLLDKLKLTQPSVPGTPPFNEGIQEKGGTLIHGDSHATVFVSPEEKTQPVKDYIQSLGGGKTFSYTMVPRVDAYYEGPTEQSPYS